MSSKCIIDMDTLRPIGVEYNRGQRPFHCITYEYNLKGNRCYVEKEDSKWIGWFKDIHRSMTIVEKTKRKVLRSLWSYINEKSR